MNQSWMKHLQLLSIRHAEACLSYDRAVAAALQTGHDDQGAAEDGSIALHSIARAKRLMEETHDELVSFVDGVAKQQFIDVLGDNEGVA